MSKTAVVQFDDRPADVLGPYRELMARNRQYAERHGYHYEFSRTLDAEVPPHWNKVYLVARMLREGFDSVAWLDSDAVVHDLDRSIESLFDRKARFVYARDLPIWNPRSPFNAGVFFCTGDLGRQIMEDWKALFPARAWSRIGGRWNYQDQVWAGDTFEQGCFANRILPRFVDSAALEELPWQVLQSPYLRPESFTLHFPNKLRLNALLYLNELSEPNV